MAFECAFCPFRTKMRGLLKQHVFYKHTDSGEINWIRCEQCSYKAKTSVHMKQHLTNKHTDERQIEWYHCTECSYKAKTKGTMKQHQLNKHTDVEQIQWVTCVECSFKTKTNGAMKQHLMKKHGASDGNSDASMIKCPECSYKTRTERTMTQHVSKKHSGVEMACDQCAYKTKTNSRLKQHVKSKHGDCRDCVYLNGDLKAPWMPSEPSAFLPSNFHTSGDPKQNFRRRSEAETAPAHIASSRVEEEAKDSRLTDANLVRPAAVDVHSRFEETKQILRSAMESTMNPALSAAHEHFGLAHFQQGFYESIWTNRL